jgi:hypothetical protein
LVQKTCRDEFSNEKKNLKKERRRPGGKGKEGDFTMPAIRDAKGRPCTEPDR